MVWLTEGSIKWSKQNKETTFNKSNPFQPDHGNEVT